MEADLAASNVLAMQAPTSCFLCPFGDHTCDIPTVEGHILRVAARGIQGTQPIILLQGADDDEIAIVLPEHARPLVNLLLALLYIPVLFVTWKAPEPATATAAPRTLRDAVWLPFLEMLSRPRAMKVITVSKTASGIAAGG